MPPFGDVSVESLVEAVEKHVARIHDAELASALIAQVTQMHAEGRHALVESVFAAFRDRGESSEDAAEGARVTLGTIERAEPEAIVALITYASENTGLLKEALVFFAERHRLAIDVLPPSLLDGIAARLTHAT